MQAALVEALTAPPGSGAVPDPASARCSRLAPTLIFMAGGPRQSWSSPIQNDSGLSQGPRGGFAARFWRQTDRSQETDVMTWSDSPWVLVYSVLVTLLVISWVYVPA
jgi:hypothetical protein